MPTYSNNTDFLLNLVKSYIYIYIYSIYSQIMNKFRFTHNNYNK